MEAFSLIVLLISCLIFFFLGIVVGYYIYSPRGGIDTSYRPKPAELLTRAVEKPKITAISPPTAESLRKKGTLYEQTEKEMEKTFDDIFNI